MLMMFILLDFNMNGEGKHDIFPDLDLMHLWKYTSYANDVYIIGF